MSLHKDIYSIIEYHLYQTKKKCNGEIFPLSSSLIAHSQNVEIF